jgi:guanylate kinase
MAHAPLIIVSGPSGSGKSTLIKGVIARWPNHLRLAVSATTRDPRPGEVNGREYHFLTREMFEHDIEQGKFLEYAEVHRQNLYGTPKAEVVPWLQKGIGVFLDVDVQGAGRMRALFPDHLSVFVKLPALWVYCKRLEERGEPLANVARRLVTAVGELDHAGEYQHQIVNDEKERATAELAALVRSHFPGLPD